MILIKGVEMPTDHPMWIVVHSDGTVEVNEVSPSRPVGWQTLRNAAVPVPPHGRLGDLDKLEQEAQKRMLICDKNDYQFQKPYEIMRAIACAPTIIPAEEGEI